MTSIRQQNQTATELSDADLGRVTGGFHWETLFVDVAPVNSSNPNEPGGVVTHTQVWVTSVSKN